MKRVVGLIVVGLCATGGALAKLPPPSDDAKAKSAEAAAKAAYGDKVGAYKQCQSMDKVAAAYLAEQKKAGKDVKPVATPPCTDPGPFAYTPQSQKPLEAAGQGHLATEQQSHRSRARGGEEKALIRGAGCRVSLLQRQQAVTA